MAPSVNIHIAAQQLREQALALELAAASEKSSEIVAGVGTIAHTLGRIIDNMEQHHQVAARQHLAKLMGVNIDAKLEQLKASMALAESMSDERPTKKK